ncbi:MAG: PAS domain S-box protein [Candidatus Dormibacteraeota bacterium]|nr:PAS domain S-box protein [Candidatus Dormibacteraeota bacterium]
MIASKVGVRIFDQAFERVLEAVPDGIVVTGGDGRIVFASQQTVSLSGYTRNELLGMPVEQLVPEGLRSRHLQHRRNYQDEPRTRAMGGHLDIRFRRKDGSEFPADIALSPLPTDGGMFFLASVRDITERKQIEEQLLRAQEQFRLVVEGAYDYAIFMLDPEGRVRSWSRGAERLKGYREDEIVGRHFSIFYPPEDVAAGKPERALAEAAESGRVEEEGWRLRKDGSRFWASVVMRAVLDPAGKLLGFAKVTRDITERKRRQERLQAFLDVAQAILEAREDQALFEIIARRARGLVEARVAAVATADPGGGSFLVRIVDGDGVDGLQGLRVPSEGTLMAGVVAGGRSALVKADPEELTLADPLLAAAGAGPALLVPLVAGGHPLGTLALANSPGGRPFDEEDLQLLEPFAAQAGVAIDYARVRGELQRLAVVADRERIGRELHDGAIQALFAVGMGLQGVASSTADASLRQRLESTVAQIDEVIRDLRNYIFGLRPGLAADRHLGQAIGELAAQLEQQHGVACAVQVDETTASRLSGRSADVIQFTREALSNVGRHAGASTCRVSLRMEGGAAVLEIDDDGRGFEPRANRGKGWGLRNLEERAAAIGGALDIASVPGEGTTVRLTVPV